MSFWQHARNHGACVSAVCAINPQHPDGPYVSTHYFLPTGREVCFTTPISVHNRDHGHMPEIGNREYGIDAMQRLTNFRALRGTTEAELRQFYDNTWQLHTEDNKAWLRRLIRFHMEPDSGYTGVLLAGEYVYE